MLLLQIPERKKMTGFADRNDQEYWITPEGIAFTKAHLGPTPDEAIGTMCHLMHVIPFEEVPNSTPIPFAWGPFEDADAWVLLALRILRHPSNRRQIEQQCLKLNGEPIAPSMFSEAINRLEKARLIVVNQKGYGITSGGQHFVDEHTKGKGTNDAKLWALLDALSLGKSA